MQLKRPPQHQTYLDPIIYYYIIISIFTPNHFYFYNKNQIKYIFKSVIDYLLLLLDETSIAIVLNFRSRIFTGNVRPLSHSLTVSEQNNSKTKKQLEAENLYLPSI